MSEIGKIYILARASGNIVKVGETTRDPQIRATEYVKEYKLVGFSLHKEYDVPLKARQDIEKIAHKKLRPMRLSWADDGGAREIFECDTYTAERAIEEAIAESEIAARELEIQRRKHLKQLRNERAQSKYNEAQSLFVKQTLQQWEVSPGTTLKKQELDKIVENNSFEKEGKRSFYDYCWFFFGWYVLICGAGFGFGTAKNILDPSVQLGFGAMLMLVVVSAGCIWFGHFIITIPVSAIPDEDALAKKNDLENEIEAKKLEVEANAKQNFQASHSLKHFL